MQVRNKAGQAMNDERGVVSIFIVIFAAIFMAIITVSFLSLMIRDQQQATNSELSQTAYDSAMSGVEDAKRAIMLCKQTPAPSGIDCSKLASGKCTTLSDMHVVAAPQTDADGNVEYPLQGTEGSNTLNQAYTCVTIDTAPSAYKTMLAENTAKVIPLSVTAPASTMTLTWTMAQGKFTAGGVIGSLYNRGAWNSAGYPPMMRAQLINGVTGSSTDSTSKTATKFLYPTITSIASAVDFATDKHNSSNSAAAASCSTSGATAQTCTVTLKMGGGSVAQNGAYLVLTPIYSSANVTLTLPSSSHFLGVQNVVDSTGRANNLFRRVQANVDLIPSPTYPSAELGLSGPLCKNFAITPQGATDNASGVCKSN